MNFPMPDQVLRFTTEIFKKYLIFLFFFGFQASNTTEGWCSNASVRYTYATTGGIGEP